MDGSGGDNGWWMVAVGIMVAYQYHDSGICI